MKNLCAVAKGYFWLGQKDFQAALLASQIQQLNCAASLLCTICRNLIISGRATVVLKQSVFSLKLLVDCVLLLVVIPKKAYVRDFLRVLTQKLERAAH